MCRDPFQEILRHGFIGALQRFDENDEGIGLRLLRVDSLDADGHPEPRRDVLGLGDTVAQAVEKTSDEKLVERKVRPRTENGMPELRRLVFVKITFP